MTISNDPAALTLADLPQLLEHDTNVKIAVCDIDGILRGKLLSKKKFLSIAATGFGLTQLIFRWDMHDAFYSKELNFPLYDTADPDLPARIDLGSFRRIPWENDVPFFLSYLMSRDGKTNHDLCSRSIMLNTSAKVEKAGMVAMAGAEYEFHNYRVPVDQHGNAPSVATFLENNPVKALPYLTQGNFCYSLTRPALNQDYYYDVVDSCRRFKCEIEGWHTECGPGVLEAALEYDEIKSMADKAAMFKWTTKAVGAKYGITPCFMAKPRSDLSGNGGHMHISIADAKTGENLFARAEADTSAPYDELKYISDLGRHFLAGILEGLPDIMPIVAPTVNSYKRLVEFVFAPTNANWGFEHRQAAIRVIAPPVASQKGTRFEFRVSGADINAHLVLSTLLALGWRGVEKKLDVKQPPLAPGTHASSTLSGEKLSKNLRAATERFRHRSSIAREILGDYFVNHYAATRDHESDLYDAAISDWEVKRYIETV